MPRELSWGVVRVRYVRKYDFDNDEFEEQFAILYDETCEKYES